MENKPLIKIVNKSKNALPEYSTTLSAGMDLRSNNDDKITIKPLERVLIKTGLFIQLPEGLEAQVRPRSGMALKHGVSVLNTPGTIDADYRGEIGVILVNLSNQEFEINCGDRIAQMVVAQYATAQFELVETLEDSERGEGGFGSTGKH
jgi:dUTP pyrophosphatase|tara:strand:- start:1843 stop:2289 length:447 start_codon:yes stop_codon:yes gene_type:complete